MPASSLTLPCNINQVAFQREMHRSELKAMRKHLTAMTEAEKKLVDEYRIPYEQLDLDLTVGWGVRVDLFLGL